MGTDSKTAVQPPPSKVAVVSSSKSSKKKKSKSSHHKSKHGKQRSDSSSSDSSNDYERSTATSSSTSKKGQITKSSKDKTKTSSNNDNRHNSKKSSINKKKSTRSKRDSSDSPPKRNNRSRSRSRSKSRSRSHSGRSSDRSSSRESPSRYRQKNSARRSGSNMGNVYQPMGHPNFPSNMSRRYVGGNPMHPRGGRMMHYAMPGMMPPGGQPMRNNNGLRRSGGGNSPPQSLLGGYRPPMGGNFRGRGGPMSNPAYVHNVANVISLLQQQQQQQQKPGSHKYNNPNNPNNRFYQQFQDNYKKISSGQKISNLYQASFPVQHIPREMRFNFRLLGRNIFTASDEEEEKKEKEKEKEKEKQKAQVAEKRTKRRDSSSSSSSSSDDDRRRRDDNDRSETDEEKLTLKNKSKTSLGEKRSTTKRNRKGSASATNVLHPKSTPVPQDLLSDPANLSSLLAEIIHGENSEAIANTLVTAAAAVNSKRERTKKQQEKKVQKFKNYARFQQIQAAAAGVQPQTNPDEVEKKIHGLARRLQMKTIGLHDDYESQGMKRSDESSVDSDTGERRRRSSASSSDRSKDKDGASDASTNSQRKSKKILKKSTKKTNAAGLSIGSSDSEQHRSDGNDSDGSMMNLNEDLKPIGYYIKDRERMLQEMFRCVRGHKLQAILPDGLKTRSLEEIKSKCLDQLDILSKKRIRAILLAQPMTSSSGTEDSTDDENQDFFSLYPSLKLTIDASTTNENTSNVTPPVPTENKKSLPNSKFRPVQMQTVSETFQSSLSAPVVVRGDEDVNDYYEGFKHIKKLSTLRRIDQDEDFLPFPDQSGKILQPIGSTGPKFEFKPITSLTHSQQAHLIARRAANRQHHKEQTKDVRQEIDDLLNIDEFVLPDGERPLSSAELSTTDQRRYGLPPRLAPRLIAGPPKKGSLGDLLKKKRKTSADRSPSPIFDDENLKSRRRRRRQRSHSFSSTGSAQRSRSRSSSSNERENRTDLTIKNDENDLNDLSKLLDLNEEDELLLLQIEVEQEERNMRREEKRRRKEEKKLKKLTKKVKSSPKEKDQQKIVRKCLDDLLDRLVDDEENRTQTKRTFDQTDSFIESDDSTKKMKIDENV